MKKRFLFLGVFFTFLCSICFAEGPGTDVVQKLVGITQTLSGIIVGISIMILVYAGFKYATAMGDPYETDKAKSQILFSGIGLMIAMSATVIVRIMGTALDIDVKEAAKASENGPSPIIFFIMGAFALLIIGTIIASVVSGKKEEETTEETKPESKVDVSVFEHTLSLVMQWKPKFEEKEEATFTSEGSRVLFQYEQSQTTLRFFQDDVVYLISTYRLESKKTDIQFVNGTHFEVSSSHHLQLQRIHEQLLQSYIQQTGTFEMWSKHLVEKLPSMNLQSRFSALLTQYQQILPLAYQLNEEERFFLEETFLRDCDLLVDSFLQLKPMQQTEHESKMMEKFEILSSQIKELENRIDSKYERDMVYAFKIIDTKYGNKKEENETEKN